MRVLGWAAAAWLLVGATAASAYDRLYVFGDSLVDSGNALTLSTAPGADPVTAAQLAALYPSGRFTNGLAGRNFADDLGRALGLGDASPYVDSLAAPGPGTNFAVGGATTVFRDGETRPDLLTEIRGLPATATSATQPYPYYYTAAAATGRVAPIDADSLVLIATGGNDVRGTVPASPGTVVDDAAQALAADAVAAALRASIDTLYAAGARNIVLVNVPDIGLIPEYAASANRAEASSLSGLVNARYGTIAGDYASRFTAAGGVFRLVDLAALQGAITRDPAAYGLDPAEVGQSCLVSGGLVAVAGGCAGYAYYDTIHPTSAVHQLIASAIVQALPSAAPEPAGWMMLIAGFGAVGVALRRPRLSARPA